MFLNLQKEKAALEWRQTAANKLWNLVRAGLEVYRHSGEKLNADPRVTEEYKTEVVKGLRLDPIGSEYDHLTKEDIAAVIEMVRRKAVAFWVPGTPRTTVLHFAHETIPTGSPCRLPPHKLKGADPQWVDDKLQEEVDRGQCVRGNSPWGSPAFPTKEFAEHRRLRKRRLVVDYRRVNARTLRAVYYIRRADDVKSEVTGSAYMTFLDAVTGVNQ